MDSASHALIVTALAGEARPLIDQWRMQRDADSHAFPLYHGRVASQPVSLIVSGIGKINAAAACAHLYNYCMPELAIWLNIGIAGHAKLPLGTPLLAHSVVDSTSGKTWYPPIVFKPACRSEHFVSVDAVSASYPESGAVDMEASAFFAIATRYSSGELVHALKIISDNRDNPPAALTTPMVTSLIGDALEVVQTTRLQVSALAAQLPRKLPREMPREILGQNTALPEAFATLRMTVSQQQQCRELLRRWHALRGNTRIPDSVFASSSRREIIANLQALVDAQTLHYAHD